MLKIYHNPRCKKSRAGVLYLQEHAKDFEIIEYMRKPLTEKELEILLIKLNKKPLEIVRIQEEYYKQKLKGKNFEDHEWIKILIQNPNLMQRPIVETLYKAVIGDPAENIAPLLITTRT
ncbi:MAG: ArsC/Spx/MgsR family protein [Bacteroidota bacterium]